MEVVMKLAHRVFLFGGQGVVEAVAGAARQAGQPAIGLKAAALVGEEAMGYVAFGIAAACEHLHDGGGSFRAEQDALGRAHHFDAVHRAGSQVGEVDLAAGIVQGDAVEQYQSAGALRAARVDGGEAALASVSRYGQARHFAEHVQHQGKFALREIGPGDDGDRNAGFLDRGLRSRGRHDDALAQASYLERDASFAGALDPGSCAVEARGGYRSVAVGGVGNGETPVGAGSGCFPGALDARAGNALTGSVQYHAAYRGASGRDG